MEPVKIGIAGLGRLGKRHAENLHGRVAGANLVAACSIVSEELMWARDALKLPHIFENYQQMLELSGLEAVFIATSSNMHGQQILMALRKGLHVFCEKPLALTLEECLRVEKEAAAFSDKVVSLGFVRRYDAGYQQAYRQISKGKIGKPFLVRSQTADLTEYAPFQVEFVKTGGGIFLDANVHDIDLARWFLAAEFKRVFALGGSYVYPEFEKQNDADNVTALCQMDNGTMAVIAMSRTMTHGHHSHTEIICTDGILQVGKPPSNTSLEISDVHGVRQECVRDFYQRFEQAFIQEAHHFTQAVRKEAKNIVSLHDGTQATRVALAMTESFKKSAVVDL